MLYVILTIFCLQSFKSPVIEAKIDDVTADLAAIRVYFNMPGLSAMAVKKGQIVAQGAAGYRRQGSSEELLITDSVNIGSCSKWMTATIAGRLVDRKLLSWTTQVHECFSNSNTFSSVFRNATLEQFLAHRTGLQQSTTFYNRHLAQLLAQRGSMRQVRRWVAETVMRDAPEVKPGEFLYANQGYAVAAAMMEQVTGKDWETLLQEHIFDPLGMTSGRVGIGYDDSLPPKTPFGHDLPLNQTVPIPRPVPIAILLQNDQAATGPGGYILCTLEDWTKFLRAHITAEQTGYLSAETVSKLRRPYEGVEGYGLGVSAFNRTWATPGQALVHSGDVFGQNTIFWMAPGRDLISVAFTNCRSESTATGLALDNAAGMLIGRYANDFNRQRATAREPLVLNHMSVMPPNA